MPRGTDRYDEARLQGRLWTPDQQASIVGCWDASDLSTLTMTTGNLVTGFASKYKNANTLTAATTARPTWSISARNGRPGITFNGSTTVLKNASSTGVPTGTDAITLIAVGYANTTGQAVGAIGIGTKSTGALRGVGKATQSTYSNVAIAQIYGTDILSTNAWYQTDAIVSGIFPSGSSPTVVVSVNGVDASASVSVNSIGSTAIGIGGYPTGTYFYTGIIQECLMFSEALSSYSRRLVEGYAAWKWGIVNRLSYDHPFKNRPPLIGD